MVPLLNRPLMQHTIELLVEHGFNNIDVLLYHQPEIIKDFFKTGKKDGVKLNYFQAPKDFGTAGAVNFACRNNKRPILVISADVVTNLDLSEIIRFHKKQKSLVTIGLTRVKNPLAYGIIITDRNGRIKQFLEKPSWGEVFSDTVNAGIYILEPEIFDFIPTDKPFDFSLDLFPLLLSKKLPLYGYISADYWLDIGQLEDYKKANLEALNNKIKLNGNGSTLNNFVLVGKGSIIADQALVRNTVIGENCKIKAGAIVNNSIIWDNVEIGNKAVLQDCIVTSNTTIGDKAVLSEGVVIGNQTEIGANAEINPFIKIWPRRIVEAGSRVSHSMIWRKHWSKSIFGQHGVTGQCNIEISPQFAAALGAAFGSVLGKGSKIACGRDSHKASRMIYRGLIAGALSTGLDISNLEMVPIPVNRFEIKSLKYKGGFHVRKSPFDQDVIDIKFFDQDGMDLPPSLEKKIERTFFAEDFVRTTLNETGELSYPYHRVAEEYKLGLLSHIDLAAIQKARLKIVVDYSFGSASQIFPSILGKLGLEVIALDAYIDENKITKDQTTFEHSLKQMTQIVRSVGADFGVLLDTGAEKIFICDEKGRILSGEQSLSLLAMLALKNHKNNTIAVPTKESKVIELLAKKYQGQVIRTKNSFRGMMEATKNTQLTFLGESQGGFIFPDFLPSFDAMLSVVKLAEYLAKEKKSLSKLCATIPASHLLKADLPCLTEHKGRLMRKILELLPATNKKETQDGIKIWHNNAWVLILPDTTDPVIHLYAEGGSKQQAIQMIKKYSKLVKQI